MPTLHALLVGIDKYPNPNHVLHGCVNDSKHFHAYLQEYCDASGFGYNPKILHDEAATRQAVIDGFGHFQSAETGDLCLFHYAGHGARSAAPEAFWGIESDHTLDSMVCWDSRLPGGYDLMDKELSYLIWQASQGKESPFVTVMDCCHSGRMRAAIGEETGTRTLRELGEALVAEHFLGYEHYRKSADGQLSPPLGRRVHLAAARDTQFAKEVKAGGQPRGVFTYCLIEALKTFGPQTSYADLLNRVNLRIRNVVADQSAQLDATFAEDRTLGFLFSRLEAGQISLLASWNKSLGYWTLNAGALNSIQPGMVLELSGDGCLLEIDSVAPNYAKVRGMDGYDTKRAYAATIRQRPVPQLTLAFASGSEPLGVEVFRRVLQAQNNGTFQLSDIPAGVDYLIHASGEAYYLSQASEMAPLFERIPGYEESSAAAFLQCLQKVANWERLVHLRNPNTGIRAAEISVELFRLAEARAKSEMDNDVPVEKMDWRSGAVPYPYFEQDGAQWQPALQCKIRNAGSRTLWVSLLYLSADFGITNILLPKLAIGPGEEAWAAEIADGYEYRTIPLKIDDDNCSSADEYLKLLISTEELNTDHYFQEGLSADALGRLDRGIGSRQQPPGGDWAEVTLQLRIER